MLRDGDRTRYLSLVEYLASRLTDLPVELEANRPAPYFPCEPPLIHCDGACRPAEFCSAF